jgi:hypothetical protein
MIPPDIRTAELIEAPRLDVEHDPGKHELPVIRDVVLRIGPWRGIKPALLGMRAIRRVKRNAFPAEAA